MSPQEIEQLARLLDGWLHAFDVDDPVSRESRKAFEALLGELYRRDCPNHVPEWREYRHHAVKACREWLRKNP